MNIFFKMSHVLFLKINYLQKKVEHIKNIFLVNSILSEKENKIKNLLLKKNSSKIFLKHSTIEIVRRHLEFRNTFIKINVHSAVDNLIKHL